MAQGTAAHFANRAPLTETASRNHFRLREWKIGSLLAACFAAVVLLMIVADVIAVLQLHRVERRAWRFYQADEKSLAILHVYLDVVTFRDTLTGLAHDQNPREFASRAAALRDNFLRDVTHAQQTLSSSPDLSQDPTILIRLGTVRAAVPSQVDAFLELVKVEDWQAVRFRLAGQLPPLIALSSSLVADVEDEVAQDRARALESIQRSRRQLYLVLPITALLILLMAGMLGWYATRRISKPLAQLDAGAQALARGEFGYRVELRGKDELSDLARAFNYAAQQLQKLYDDIRRSEAYLAESKAKLEEAQRITHVGHWEWDLATDCLIWSDETYRIYGLRPQERPINLDALREMIHPEDRDFVFREAEGSLRSSARYDVEHRIVRSSGEVRVLNSTRAVKKDETGRPTHFYGTVQDITDRKRAEEALQVMSRDLQESKDRLEEAQRITHVGYWEWDVLTDRINWSDETYRIYGLRPQERPMDLATVREKIHPEDWGGVSRGLEEALSSDALYNVECRVLRPTGEVRIIDSQGHVKRDASGQPTLMFGTVQDITDRRRAEHEREKLRQLEADLAHVNRVSTLGEMAASLAHEIKQPIAAAITSANSCIEWLAHEPPNLDRARAAAARIDKYGNRAAEIIDRIRSLYRKSPPQRELVDMNGIIQEMLTLLKAEATRYSVSMRTELSSQLPKITADRVQLQQVFMNLMLNGIEAMSDSGGELTIKSELEDGQLQFSVSDTGVGLPGEEVDRVFSAFFTTKPQGSGMGLAISRSIVESHGGRLWATANGGRGATFHFILPIQVTESSPLVA
jgi:PAS domain S-box-containing protein